jgi:hypothetical protein
MAGDRAPRRLRGTIRFRITALAVVAVALVLAVTAGALVTVQRRQLTANLDSSLVQRADDLAALVAGDSDLSEFGGGGHEGFAQLVTPDGRVLAASPNLAGASPIPLGLDPDQNQTIRTVEGLPLDDDAFRVISREVVTSAGPAILHVGASFDEVGESTGILTGSLAVGIPVVVGLLALLVWWLVGRTLAGCRSRPETTRSPGWPTP